MSDLYILGIAIDEAVSSNVVQLSNIDYDTPYSCVKSESKERNFELLIANYFSKIWLDEYARITQTSNEILEFSDGHYQCLFDYNYERVVCFFGVSQPATNVREKKRQSGFIPGFTKHYPGKDRGHFLSHCQGGGMDVNFFPQNKEINRGWSDAGKIYRKMERFCSVNPGIFCFSRPLYHTGNVTWVPQQIEYGIIAHEQYHVVVFPN